MAKPVIRLTRFQLHSVAVVGIQRQIESTYNGDRDKAVSHNHWNIAIEGAAAELAVSLHTRQHWPMSVNTYKTIPDVGDDEVRHCEGDGGRLLIQPDDDDGRLYWLVTGRSGVYTIHGYLLGRLCKDLRFWDNKMPRPCYAVPQAELHV